MIQGQTLTGIADAIRGKLETEQQYTPESMAAAIGNIQGGGSTEIEDALISRKISGKYTNNRVLGIGANAFKSCSGLTEVRFDKAASVGNAAFSSCSNIVKGYFPAAETTENQTFLSLLKSEVLYFGKLKTVAVQAFQNVGSSLSDPKKSIIIIATPTVCTLVNTNGFYMFSGNIYVPDNLFEQYKVETNWVTIADQIKRLSELPSEVQEWLDQQGGASS